jgi:hypothetical protein
MIKNKLEKFSGQIIKSYEEGFSFKNLIYNDAEIYSFDEVSQ